MTNGLIKGRKTAFYKGYAIQWFTQFLVTKIMIYADIPGNTYICMTEFKILDTISDEEVIKVAKAKIEEIESL